MIKITIQQLKQLKQTQQLFEYYEKTNQLFEEGVIVKDLSVETIREREIQQSNINLSI